MLQIANMQQPPAGTIYSPQLEFHREIVPFLCKGLNSTSHKQFHPILPPEASQGKWWPVRTIYLPSMFRRLGTSGLKNQRHGRLLDPFLDGPIIVKETNSLSKLPTSLRVTSLQLISLLAG